MRIQHLLGTLALGLGLTLALLMSLSLSPAQAAPDALFVTLAGSGDCSQANPCNLQTALSTASDGDTIYVAGGTYTGTGGAVITVTQSITLYGGWDGSTTGPVVRDPDAHPTTLDGENGRRGVYVAGSITVTLDGLQIAHGNATGLGGGGTDQEDGVGGGVYVYTATVTLHDCTVYSNTANTDGNGYGGGVYARNSRLTLNASTVQSNTASVGGPYTRGYGGGVALENSPYAVLESNLIRDNHALNASGESGYGGGVAFLYSEHATLTGNTVRGNTACGANGNGDGGGLYFWHSGYAALTDNLVQSNVASQNGLGNGGGVSIDYSDYITMTGNTAKDNVATHSQSDAGSGGGVMAYSKYMTLSRNIFAHNIASTGNDDGEGGGIAVSGANATIVDNVIVDNIASNHGTGHGGGAILYSDGLSLQGNTILRNLASVDGDGYGGGITIQWVTGGVVDVNVIVSNTATFSPTAVGIGGGAEVAHGQALTWTNNIVAGNQANTAGSGLRFVANLWAPGDAVLRHTTIAANRGGEGVYVGGYSTLALTDTILVSHTVGISVTAGSTATLEATLWGSGAWANGADWGGDGAIVTGTVNIWGDPAFLAPDDDNYHIRADSAAVDAGVDAGVTTDIDGEARPNNGVYDIGADEFYCYALTGASINGPTAGDTGVSYVFTATVAPPTATLPVTYTWQASGQSDVVQSGAFTQTTVPFTWSSPGTQVVTVTAQNCGGTNVATHTVVISTKVYLPLVLRNYQP